MKGMMTMMCSHLPERKITIVGPRKEIDDLRTYLINETQRVEVVKSSPHFPFGDTTMDLCLLVCGREMDGVVQSIRHRLALSSIYIGWIDASQVFYPIHRPKQRA